MVTYGTEKEYALFNPRQNFANAMLGVHCAMFRKHPHSVLPGATSFYVDGTHLELTSPAVTSVRQAVANSRKMDRYVGKFCTSVGMACWRTNHFERATFGVHDNYACSDDEWRCLRHTAWCDKRLSAFLANLPLICGEGGFISDTQYYASPRCALRRRAYIVKDECNVNRLQIYSWDNCSPHSAAIRVGSVACVMSLISGKKFPSHDGLKGGAAPPVAMETWASEKFEVPPSWQSGADFLLQVARAAEKQIDSMPPHMDKVIQLWKAAAASVAAGKPLPTIDWELKRRFLARLAAQRPKITAEELSEACVNWSRMDTPGVYDQVEDSVFDDVAHWSKVEPPKCKNFIWSYAARLTDEGNIVTVNRCSGAVLSRYDKLDADCQARPFIPSLTTGLEGPVRSVDASDGKMRAMIIGGKRAFKTGSVLGYSAAGVRVKLDDKEVVTAEKSKVFVY